MFIVAAITSGVLLAEPPQEIGTWASLGGLTSPPPGAAAVTLPDGRTFILGGTNVDGEPVNGVLAFTLASGAPTSAGALVEPRTGHTATLLRDGRVAVVGGITTGNLISHEIEIFDPAAGTSSIVSVLPEPRHGHAAALLADGRVLIVGGTTTDGVIVRSAVIFDPKTFSSTAAGELRVMRTNAAAATLLDGRVLVVGGSNGSTDLATAEIYEPSSQTFSIAATRMAVARQTLAAILLPYNGGVLVTGGTSNGEAQSAADLFLPAVFPDPFSYGEGEFAATEAMTVPRAVPIVGPTEFEGFAFAAGSASIAEAYRFATIKTDTDDYAPGQQAVITGSGWQPGEDVTLVFQEDPAVHDDYRLTVMADDAGNISWDQWAPEGHDLGVRFYLTAIGSRSRAQVTFTDAADTTTTLSTSPNPSTAGASVTATASVASGGAPVTQGVVKFYFGGANCTGNAGTQFGAAAGVGLNGSGQASASTTLLTNGVIVRACYQGFGSGSSALQSSVATVTQTVGGNVDTVTTVSSSANPSTFGGSIMFNAVVSRTSGSGTPTGAVQFIVDGANFGGPVALGVPGSDTFATASSAAITTLAAGAHRVQANYVPTGTFVASSDLLDGGQAVNKADAVCTINGHTGVYDAAAHGATGSCTGVGGAATDGNLDLGSSFTDAPGGTAIWSFAGSTNYKDQGGTVDIVINQANAVCAITGYTGIYDGNPHGASGSCSGVDNGAAAGTSLDLGAKFTNVPGGTATWTFEGGTNYQDQSGSLAVTIARADATITVNRYTGIYDAQAHGASGTVTGVLNEALAGLTLGATFADHPGGTAHWTFTDETGNYNDASGDVAIVIDRATAVVVVSGYTGTYDAQPHRATGSATGVGAVDLTAALNLGDSFTNVPGGTAHWAFTGGTNYYDASGSVPINIAPATAACVVSGYDVVYDGALHGATGSCTGVGGAALSGLNLNGTKHQNAGQYTDAWTFTDPNGNYQDASGTVSDVIRHWTTSGFYQPVDMSGAQAVWNTVKGGSTVPLKFNLFAGAEKKISVGDVKSFAVGEIACAGSSTESAVEFTTTGGTQLRYDGVAGQFIQNWQTPKTAGKCYVARTTAQDGSSIDAFFKTK